MNLSQFIHFMRPVLAIAVTQKTLPSTFRNSKKWKGQFEHANEHIPSLLSCFHYFCFILMLCTYLLLIANYSGLIANTLLATT